MLNYWYKWARTEASNMFCGVFRKAQKELDLHYQTLIVPKQNNG
jgi:hypothetical protein